MTEIATRQPGAVELAPTPPEAVTAAIEQWVGGMAAAVRGAEYIVDTPLCPDSYWPVPAGQKSKAPKQMLPGETRESFLARRQVAVYTLGGIVRYGLQLGLPPEVAMQGIFMIGGRPSMYAEQMVGLVKSRGHSHRIILRSTEECVVHVRRLGDQEWQEFTYTIDDAIRAGHVPGQGPNANLGKWPDGKPKTGGNEKYLTEPATMLYCRASSIACRAVFPDVLRGLVSYEETIDERVSVVVEPAPAPAVRVTADEIRARVQPAKPAAPAPAPEPEVQRMVMPVSKPQLELIKAIFERAGMGSRAAAVRADRMRVLSVLVDRPIEDPRDLTGDEGKLIIDTLGLEENASRVIAETLDRPWPVAPAPDTEATPEQAAWAPLTQHAGDVTEVADAAGEDHDPTVDPEWPFMTPGGDMAGEGQ